MMLKFRFTLHITVWRQKEKKQMKKKHHNLYVKENANRGYCYSQGAHFSNAACSVFFSEHLQVIKVTKDKVSVLNDPKHLNKPVLRGISQLLCVLSVWIDTDCSLLLNWCWRS